MGTKPFVVDKTKVSDFAKELGDLFTEENHSLIHLDISHNNLNYVDCEYLSKKIVKNHTILGIHVDGNELTIDDLGFLYPIDKEKLKNNYYANSQIYYSIDHSLNIYNSNAKLTNEIRSIRAKNNCWICENWRETKFHFKPQKISANHNNFNPSKTKG